MYTSVCWVQLTPNIVLVTFLSYRSHSAPTCDDFTTLFTVDKDLIKTATPALFLPRNHPPTHSHSSTNSQTEFYNEWLWAEVDQASVSRVFDREEENKRLFSSSFHHWMVEVRGQWWGGGNYYVLVITVTQPINTCPYKATAASRNLRNGGLCSRENTRYIVTNTQQNKPLHKLTETASTVFSCYFLPKMNSRLSSSSCSELPIVSCLHA